MVSIKKSALVLYSREEMFNLVDSVEDYPDFLPWCGGTEVIKKTNKITKASIKINYRGVKQTFTTENNKNAPEKMIIKLINGPFKKLSGEWRFIELDKDACRIELELHYQFSNIILEKLISPVFNIIANTFIDNFVEEANRRNGV
tara:strand:+ start:45 stop:479 length:435 start_codon:yes stop_codon:yes gene_type:complete